MLLYDGVGPNPRVVRMFAAELGLKLPSQWVDLRGGENRQAAYLTKVPLGQLPALALDEGLVLSEITAICEYLDDTQRAQAPEGPTLIGRSVLARAETRMWTRRIDLNICEPLVAGFRYAEGLKLFAPRMHCMPHAADDFKAVVRQKLAWLDGQLAGHAFVCGDRLSLADLLLFCFVEFGAGVGQAPDPALLNLQALLQRIRARPSAQA